MAESPGNSADLGLVTLDAEAPATWTDLTGLAVALVPVLVLAGLVLLALAPVAATIAVVLVAGAAVAVLGLRAP
jgi:hypothetical protein